MNQETKNLIFRGVYENPIFVLALGLCPVIAVATSLENALFLGVATLFVLFFSNVIISSLRKVIGNEIRIVAFVLIIATFTTIVQMLSQKFLPSIYESVGVFIPLIAVNCIIMARAEAFAKNNTVAKSAIDGLSMGFGFIGAILVVGFVRELFGSNSLTLFGYTQVFGAGFHPLEILNTVAGGFLTLGILLMLINSVVLLSKKTRESRLKTKMQAAANEEKEIKDKEGRV